MTAHQQLINMELNLFSSTQTSCIATIEFVELVELVELYVVELEMEVEGLQVI